ncbi:MULTISPECIES: hypothetical protein [Methanosarcina]|jgi:hypothetical protein|nr:MULTISPECIES: hypothetical protein [Methanosarcina]AGF95966.1 hypothetical protein MmTuc01_0546 [Methanosarcina mazei Tuc01]AKB39760.1 hypothetical protein MSMAW_0769 [Methanosarcina mazei WWM610]AKB60728.1 hypothetical protein MSMAP_0743 [Methanosarcina mazei SarPi]AKB67188.1 hypothetical protein MSMAL_0645 [Methanosarcina mazei LYC]AKB70652.1 hypothetical protein MSMAC_0762 [Methanosarcina mazei C16]
MIADFREIIKGDRVRANTPPEINEAIDREIAASVRFYAGKTDYEISRRIEELCSEWDIGRHVETRAAVISIVGLVLGFKRGRKWFVLPLIATTFLLLYAVLGWAPPVPFLRKAGIRTRQEIDVEKYALRVLRGDFDDLFSQENRTENAENFSEINDV